MSSESGEVAATEPRTSGTPTSAVSGHCSGSETWAAVSGDENTGWRAATAVRVCHVTMCHEGMRGSILGYLGAGALLTVPSVHPSHIRLLQSDATIEYIYKDIKWNNIALAE